MAYDFFECKCGFEIFVMGGRIAHPRGQGFPVGPHYVVCASCGTVYNDNGEEVTRTDVKPELEPEPTS